MIKLQNKKTALEIIDSALPPHPQANRALPLIPMDFSWARVLQVSLRNLLGDWNSSLGMSQLLLPKQGFASIEIHSFPFVLFYFDWKTDFYSNSSLT